MGHERSHAFPGWGIFPGWGAFLLVPVILLVAGCETHPPPKAIECNGMLWVSGDRRIQAGFDLDLGDQQRFNEQVMIYACLSTATGDTLGPKIRAQFAALRPVSPPGVTIQPAARQAKSRRSGIYPFKVTVQPGTHGRIKLHLYLAGRSQGPHVLVVRGPDIASGPEGWTFYYPD